MISPDRGTASEEWIDEFGGSLETLNEDVFVSDDLSKILLANQG